MSFSQTFGINETNKDKFANLYGTIAVLEKLLYHQINEEIDQDIFNNTFEEERRKLKKLQNELNISVVTMQQFCEMSDLKTDMIWSNLNEIDKKADLGRTALVFQAGALVTNFNDLITCHLNGSNIKKAKDFEEKIEEIYQYLRSAASEEDFENSIYPIFNNFYNLLKKCRPDDILPRNEVQKFGDQVYLFLESFKFNQSK